MLTKDLKIPVQETFLIIINVENSHVAYLFI